MNFGLFSDPKRDGLPLRDSVYYYSGGGDYLGAETSRSSSVGFFLEPKYAPGLRMSFDWTDIRKVDNLNAITPLQSILDMEDDFPGVFIREEGEIVGLDGRWKNMSELRVSSYDFSVDYKYSNDNLELGGGSEGLLTKK